MPQISIKIRRETLSKIDAARARYIGRTGKPLDRSAYLARVVEKLDGVNLVLVADELVKEQTAGAIAGGAGG